MHRPALLIADDDEGFQYRGYTSSQRAVSGCFVTPQIFSIINKTT